MDLAVTAAAFIMDHSVYRTFFLKIFIIISFFQTTCSTESHSKKETYIVILASEDYFDDFREDDHHHQLYSSTHKIDLLEILDLRNHSVEGVEYRPGPHSPTPAAHFGTGGTRAAFVSQSRAIPISELLSFQPKDIAILASIKQRKGNSGSLFSLLDSQNARLLELQSSGRQNVLRLQYRSSLSSSLLIETIPVSLADDKWHKLSLTLSGDLLRVFVDCRSVYDGVIHPLSLGNARALQNLTLWVGQSSGNRFLFKGYLQNFHLVAGRNGHLLQCPKAEVSCPTCGEFRTLQKLVYNLRLSHQRELSELKKRLESAESRLEKVEECECANSCKDRKEETREHGSSWTEGCQTCTCNRGKVTCVEKRCPELDCIDPYPANATEGACCPRCKENCVFRGREYSHGSFISPFLCVNCSCDNGWMKCLRRNFTQDPCPVLDCTEEEQILEDGECCKVCKADYCARGHDCHPRAHCINLEFNYTCSCAHGFFGDGKVCHDIDECAQEGDSLERTGHHCSAKYSVCVNTFGSYRCECETGFERVMNGGTMTCEVRDICATDQPCHTNATCLNTAPGQFTCVCKDGFRGDGIRECSPSCTLGCENGGSCVSTDICSCPSGFWGDRCQFDVDECATGAHRCAGDSRCINKPGWYYCQCRSGYRTYQDPFSKGQTICIDEDECEMGSDSCHPSTVCVNTDGSYNCHCPYHDDEIGNCSADCIMEDGKEEKRNNSTWLEGCNTCTCENGKIECAPPICDCSQELVDPGCCPQCYDPRTCIHVGADSSKSLFRSGDRWLENCNECECLHGEVDCWPLDCPPTSPDCLNLVILPGDCCPTCNLASTKNHSCIERGTRHANGERWTLSDECTKCDCRNGFVYCSTDPSCKSMDSVAKTAFNGLSPSLPPDEET